MGALVPALFVWHVTTHAVLSVPVLSERAVSATRRGYFKGTRFQSVVRHMPLPGVMCQSTSFEHIVPLFIIYNMVGTQ